MIWFSDPQAPVEDEFSVTLHGCGRISGGLANALDAGGTPTRVVECGTELTRSESDAPSILVLGPAIADPRVTLATAVASDAWDGIMVLSDRGDLRDAVWALDGGAHDVLCPPHSASAIRFRAAVVHRRLAGARRRNYFRPVALRMDFEPATRRVRTPRMSVDLSEREYELFERLAEAKGEVVSRGALLHDIWGAEQTSEAVLDATVHRLRRKLEADIADPRIITTVRGIGYRLEHIAMPSDPDGGRMLRAG